MNNKIWLLNDCLTTIPGTRTFWHDLIDWIPNISDKTGGYTPFNKLARKTEFNYWMSFKKPDLLIRNASFFRKLNMSTKTISLLQDVLENNCQQIDVCNNSNMVVFNSNYTYSIYKNKLLKDHMIIPLGINTDYFIPPSNKDLLKSKLGLTEKTLLFIGASNTYPKGFNIVLDLISNTNYNFCLVMKDDFKIDHPRVKVFNKISHDLLLEIYQSCDLLICTSYQETQHLAGIEAASCGLPIVASNVGVYHNLFNSSFGEVSKDFETSSFIQLIEKVLLNPSDYNPRSFVLKSKLTKNDCKESWQSLVINL